jgi:AraC-like DNA-binding protein
MPEKFSTTTMSFEQRLNGWRDSVASAYFELDLEFADPERFDGELVSYDLNDVSLSVLRSDALRYRRLASHLHDAINEDYLLTVPDTSEIEFTQRGRSTTCAPGSFTLERSGEPYEFSYDKPNLLRVLKIPERALRLRIGTPDRLCAIRFDARTGAGALFVDYLALAARHVDGLSSASAGTVGTQLLDLLAVVLEGAGEVGESQETAVQGGHLRRIERYIRTHLGEADLAPATIAQAGGVSVRYLHRLFRNTDRTVAEHIRELRLEACSEELSKAGADFSLGTLAYKWGFSDQSHFCRVFKARYGMSPGEARRAALARLA